MQMGDGFWTTTAPTWIAAIGTGGALLLGFYILLRDRRKEEASQASKIAHWWEGDKCVVLNGSDAPIVSINIYAEHILWRDAVRGEGLLLGTAGYMEGRQKSWIEPSNRPTGKAPGILLPQERCEFLAPPWIATANWLTYWLTFADAHNRRWDTNLQSGRLKSRLPFRLPRFGRMVVGPIIFVGTMVEIYFKWREKRRERKALKRRLR